MKTIYLVSCVKDKAEGPLSAKTLYRSDWFRKARAYVEHKVQPGDSWFILSAQHHLVEPERILTKYNTKLGDMNRAERRSWAKTVLEQLRPILIAGDWVIILAGKLYREDLEETLDHRGFKVEVPMAHLGIGQQKAWLARAVREGGETRESA